MAIQNEERTEKELREKAGKAWRETGQRQGRCKEEIDNMESCRKGQ